ncbi:zinc finger protein 337-like isoform X3 [Schistocerca piceifrons]|uniref:zinc finger protein 337-like isoform X3 n=1 Tax=Schistocerca piceifrons TaxID=274613 RepID=UPI001F5F8ADB|nr:zinc finger protein 337-like isoform X3 [Schistocerca piceifrons]
MVCERGFKRKHHLTYHVNICRKAQQGKFLCIRCGRSYTSKHSLSSHQRFECGVVPQFICMVCERGFKRKHHLTYHVNICRKAQQGKFLCIRCGRSYTSKHSLSSHQRFECGVVRQFICMVCERRFKRKAHLSHHVKRCYKAQQGKNPEGRSSVSGLQTCISNK